MDRENIFASIVMHNLKYANIFKIIQYLITY